MFFAETNGILISTLSVLGIFGGAGAVIAFLFRLLIASKDREFAMLLAQKEVERLDLEGMKKSYQEIAVEAQQTAINTANYYREKYESKPPLIIVAPVVSESHSPSTARQRETAFIATMRATMANIRLATGQESRPEPERAVESPPTLPMK